MGRGTGGPPAAITTLKPTARRVTCLPGCPRPSPTPPLSLPLAEHLLGNHTRAFGRSDGLVLLLLPDPKCTVTVLRSEGPCVVSRGHLLPWRSSLGSRWSPGEYLWILITVMVTIKSLSQRNNCINEEEDREGRSTWGNRKTQVGGGGHSGGRIWGGGHGEEEDPGGGGHGEKDMGRRRT